MVVVQRRQGYPEVPPLRSPPQRNSPYRYESSCEISPGTAESSSEWSYSSSPEPSWRVPTKASRRRSSSVVDMPAWMKGLAISLSVLSWILSASTSTGVSSAMSGLREQLELSGVHKDQLLQSLDDMKRKLKYGKNTLKYLTKTGNVLNHEISVIDQMGDDWEPSKGKGKLIDKWMSNRKRSLETKTINMQKFLQTKSKESVKERYGKGPHRVKVTVDIPNSKKASERSSFVVQLASVEKMPHSVHFFLDLVEHGIWNDTVFLHHEDVDHVIAAAPIDYESHKIKFAEMADLVWVGLGFPEYDPKLPHSKYTLGFADKGPTWYINTVDNSELHGPGGQGHHTLDSDADPCFARVIKGSETIEALIKFGLKNNKFHKDGLHPWADDEHHWTRIVSAEII